MKNESIHHRLMSRIQEILSLISKNNQYIQITIPFNSIYKIYIY